MFELIVSWLTNEQETSMNWAIRRWNDDSSGRGGILINLRNRVGCSTHHCGGVRTVSPTFIRRSDLDAVQDKDGFHYFVCIYKKDGRGPSVPIPPETNSHFFLPGSLYEVFNRTGSFYYIFRYLWMGVDR